MDDSTGDQSNDSLLKRLQTTDQRAFKYSKVAVRVGPKPDEYQLPLFPLVTQSVKCQKLIESIFDRDWKGPGLVIGMPDFQCDEDVFRIVEDNFYGAMDEKDISTSNAVRLFNAGKFLEMDCVKNRVWTFLESNAFVSWESCLDVLATFDCNDLPRSNSDSGDAHIGRCDEKILFERCRKALLDNIVAELSTSDMWKKATALDCTFEFLVRMAQILPPNVAEHVYQSCREERVGLYLNSNVWDNNAEEYSVYNWVEWLPDLLPDLVKRSLFVSHLSKTLLLPSDDDVKGIIILSKFQWGFLCVLLAEAAQLAARYEKDSLATGLQEENFLLEKLVCQGLGQLYSKDQEWILMLLLKFKSGTLLSIVGHCRDFCNEIAAGVATVVDSCVQQHLQSGSLTPEQALLIYKEFPNNARPSHVELYRTLTVKALSSEELLQLTELLDYDKLPADMVDKLFEELELPTCEFRLAKKYVEMQLVKRNERKRSSQKLNKLRSVLGARNQKLIAVTESLRALHKSRGLAVKDRNVLISEKKKFGRERRRLKACIRALVVDRDEWQEAKTLVETELDQLKESQERVEVDRDALQEGKRLVENELDELRETKRRVEVDRDALQDGKRLVENELDQLRETKRRVEVDRDALQEGKRLAENELDQLRETKRRLKVDKDALQDGKSSAENELHQLKKSKRKVELHRDALLEVKMVAKKERDELLEKKNALEKGISNALQGIQLAERQRDAAQMDFKVEKLKSTCQLCHQKPRDTVSYPCMHFHHCSDCLQKYHQHQGFHCPTCKHLTTGVLMKCKI